MRTHIQLHGSNNSSTAATSTARQQQQQPSSNTSDYSDALTISQPRCVPKWLPLFNKKRKKQQDP